MSNVNVIYPITVTTPQASSASALTAIDTSTLKNGYNYQITQNDVFTLDKNSTATPNASTIIAATPIGNWLSSTIPNIILTENGKIDYSCLPFSTLITDNSQFVGVSNAIYASAGTWLVVRTAQGLYNYAKAAAADTSTIAIELLAPSRSLIATGFKLISFDVIYTITTANLNAHTYTLNQATYANAAVATSAVIATTGTLQTATQASSYVTNVTVNTPTWVNTSDTKYTLEITVNAATTSLYAVAGVNLYFSSNYLYNVVS